MQEIRLASAPLAILMRNNVGSLEDKRGRWVQFGLMKGSSDLIGIRKADGKFVALEVKLTGKKPTEEQKNFIDVIRKNGGIAAVVTSVEEALSALSMT